MLDNSYDNYFVRVLFVSTYITWSIQ